jgi:cytochrome c oxidase assembly protein subunit 11
MTHLGSTETQAEVERRKKRMAMACTALPLVMLGLSFAAVPLYTLFCQVTGYGGTTQRAIALSTTSIDRPIEILFDANVRGISWTFEPVQRSITLKLGENGLAFYRATNTSDKPLTGTAAFNVDPPAAGIHFQKVECFCFKEQTLQPGESMDMPVTFYVDPALATDKDARGIGRIVLSYTFFKTEPTVPAKSAAVAPSAGTGSNEAVTTKGSGKQGT